MKLAVQFGAGGVGRGFLGQLLSESGYQTVFVDVDRELVELLNSKTSYPLQLVGDRNQRLTISNVRALMAEQTEDVARAIAQADFICTASGVPALPSVSKLLALGLHHREQEGAGPVNVVICENLNRASQYLRELIEKQPLRPCDEYLDQNVGFAQAVVARMVPLRTAEMLAKDPLLILAESYPFLPVDAAALRGGIPALKGLIPAQDFQAYVDRKLYIHNGMHAICAYMGHAKGYEFVYQAASDPGILAVVEPTMSGICTSLARVHPLDPVGLAENVYDLLRRFRCRALADTVARIAANPIRKLAGPDGRLIGPARLCLAQGIDPAGIVHGIALALHYDEPNEHDSQRPQQMIAKTGLSTVLQEICGLAPDEQLSQLILAEYKKTSN